MDPSKYPQYSPPNGLPQESKLATYMNRSASTSTRSLNQGMSSLTLEPSPSTSNKPIMHHHMRPQAIIGHPPPPQTIIGHPPPPQALIGHSPPPQIIAHMPPRQVLMGEFVPINYFNPMAMMPESSANSPPIAMTMQPVGPHVHQENVGGTTYFYPTTTDGLNTVGGLAAPGSLGPEACVGAGYMPQMYAAPPLMQPLQNKPGLASTFYMPETIKDDIFQRNDDLYLLADIGQYPEVPECVDMYTDLIPLEPAGGGGGGPATAFRAAHRVTGELVALRRVAAGISPARLDPWRRLDHPNIVRLHRVFPTPAFGDHSLLLVYDYHPGSVSLMNKYLNGGSPPGTEAGVFHDPFSSDPDAPRPYTHQRNAMLRAVACGALLPEAVLWSMLVQLTAALRAVHSAGLACRTLDPTKVVMSGCRVRIAWCGIGELHGGTVDIAQAQQEDLTALGRLTLALACRSVQLDNLPACMELVARTYSPDLKNLILYLLSSSARRSVTDLMPMIGARFYTQVEALESRADAFEDQLARESDNGRLLQILFKLGAINERPELNMDAAWAETGDRYMLKLFRDYLFHSVTPDGRPWLDRSHMAFALNNLDVGTHSRVVLMSRDEQSILVVSFAELKHCLEQAFDEVMQAAAPPLPYLP